MQIAWSGAKDLPAPTWIKSSLLVGLEAQAWSALRLSSSMLLVMSSTVLAAAASVTEKPGRLCSQRLHQHMMRAESTTNA